MVRCQCVVERWRAIKGEIGDLIIVGPALQEMVQDFYVGVGLGRDSEIAVPTLQVSIGFTLEFLWDLLSPSLISQLIAHYSFA